MLINGREEGCVGQPVDCDPSSGLNRTAQLLILQKKPQLLRYIVITPSTNQRVIITCFNKPPHLLVVPTVLTTRVCSCSTVTCLTLSSNQHTVLQSPHTTFICKYKLNTCLLACSVHSQVSYGNDSVSGNQLSFCY
jgi:hypothetical protein